MFRRTLARLGGGVVHPDAFRAGRRPGQAAPRNLAQMSGWEWMSMIASVAGMGFPMVIIYIRCYRLNTSAWIDNHYDPLEAYEKTWEAEHVTAEVKKLRPGGFA
eukprot:TRINITY_DN3913_c1_g2_i1.p1 TRINITY_DN3913_c1_g2~~TRINITY_DN3913_c1_g2_i1.p1  ORF type:complete len:104 (+),score=9.41 TRINITY_DN3913_c1_g2_i1:43-354(+)